MILVINKIIKKIINNHFLFELNIFIKITNDSYKK